MKLTFEIAVGQESVESIFSDANYQFRDSLFEFRISFMFELTLLSSC